MTITAYISIGNSDDKLSQYEWKRFVSLVRDVVRTDTSDVHGEWFSASDSMYQNACWCVEVKEGDAPGMKANLASIAAYFKQDSIAWAVAETEFITPRLAVPAEAA